MRVCICVVVLFAAVGLADDPGPAEVRYDGQMRKVMQDGDLSAAIDLRKLAKMKDLYALGPLDGLKGEVTIWDGKPSVARIRDGKVAISDSFEHKACFLVYAEVKSWQEVAIPDEIKDEKQLEEFVKGAGAEAGIEVKRPFPFLVKAAPKKVTLHVVNKTDDSPHTKESHEKIKLRFSVENEAVQIVGFYSDSHHGVFTHHTTNIHMHAITDDGKQSGHVETIQFGKGGKLLLPKR